MAENCSGRKAGAGRAVTLAGIGECSDIDAQHRAAAGSRGKRGNLEDAPAQRHQDSVSRPLADGTLTRRGFLMINSALIGAIAAAGSCDLQPPELPLSVHGLQGWVSTTKGRFLFDDGTITPGHDKGIHEARNVQGGQALFRQDTPELRPTWDATTFDVPCIRSDGTQYLIRETSLTPPGLVIIGCAFDSSITGFHALTGSRSTETPGGDEPREDAWTLNKTSNNNMRGLIATSSGQMIADTPQILGEKLLVMLEIVGNAMQVWQVGATGEQTLVGTRIAADGEQALLAKYFDDALIAIMQGAIFEFLQYAPAPSRTQRRLLVQYLQGLIWPAVSPPIAATVNAGQVQRGASKSIDVVAPSSGSSLVLASIDEQPAAGGFSISGNNVVISASAGAALGNRRGYYCLRSNVPGSRLVDFGQVDFEVIAAAAPPQLPFFGLYYGADGFGAGASNTHIKASTERAVSFFFYAERSGTIDKLFFQPRKGTEDEGYSEGDGGIYTIEVRTADASTKLPTLLSNGGQIISSIAGWEPGNNGSSTNWITLNFTSTPGQTQAGQPYCLVFRNTHADPGTNYFSTNISSHHNFSGGPGGGSQQPANYQEPAGLNPASVGSSPTPVAGWVPMLMPNGARMFPWTAKAVNGLFQYNRHGPEHACLRYSDGQWTGFGHAGGQGEPALTLLLDSASDMFRERFRVSRANRVVDGVFIRLARQNATTGTLTVRLEQGPVTDAHNASNGMVVESVAVPHTAIYDAGAGICSKEITCGANLNFTPYLWVPFTQNRTLVQGTIYNLRLSATSGLVIQIVCSDRPDDQGLLPRGFQTATWDQWEATRQLPWQAFEDSRGLQFSTNGGTNWSYQNPQRIAPITFRCVTS
jgi:hypothetical protein